jgi:hypothetical protein
MILPRGEPGDDGPGELLGERFAEHAATEVDACVRQREHRDDEERADRVQRLLEITEHGAAADRVRGSEQTDGDPDQRGVHPGLERRHPRSGGPAAKSAPSTSTIA